MLNIVPNSHPSDTAIVAILQASVPDLRMVYRYGSAGGGFERADSDIDLTVLADQPLSFDELSGLKIELMRLTGRDVDLTRMVTKPTPVP